MPNNVDEMQQLGKDNMDAATESFGVASKAFQAIATEVANYSNIVAGPYGGHGEAHGRKVTGTGYAGPDRIRQIGV